MNNYVMVRRQNAIVISEIVRVSKNDLNWKLWIIADGEWNCSSWMFNMERETEERAR